ncbi:MAG: MFS transporter, partial [Candidatus Marsarchaeota archaeon]|nr:MFS transporter [Candidatus Marsarchaeota archaeon]
PPNTAFVMSSVPPEYRGIASGMRATILNVAFMFSLAIFFSLLILGVSSSLPAALYNGLVAQNVSVNTASQLSIDIPPSAALFAALLGYSPLKALIPQSTMNTIPIRNQEVILSTSFFPNLISEPFMEGMRIVMYAGAAMALLAAIFSAIKTRRPHENGGGLP